MCDHANPKGTIVQRRALQRLYAKLGVVIRVYAGCVPCGIEQYAVPLKKLDIHHGDD